MTCDFRNFAPECKCNGNGTTNGSLSCNQDSGQCPCKDNIHQRTCSECRDGFYSFPKSVEVDCLQCDCDYGGSIEEICEKTNGLYKKCCLFKLPVVDINITGPSWKLPLVLSRLLLWYR